ncbi:MAG: ERAD-associated protein [Icmadophila ericetorum]|nr:ERAD-associated protein [Icmadophila ericetorum]
MPHHQTKRQRLSDSTDKLKQPFKSPFSKSTIKPSSDPPEKAITPNATPTITPSSSPTKTSPLPHKRPQHQPHLSSSPAKVDPEITVLQKQHTALLSQLNQIRTELDTHTQAVKIETSSRDKELERLIVLWKGASRSAAEEVYAKVKDRVNRMGGVGAWKEKERNSGWGGGWDEEKKDTHEEDVDERGNAEREDERDGLEQERMDRYKADEVDEDAGFTMDMMLKNLNIELGLIGFDREGQRWID